MNDNKPSDDKAQFDMYHFFSRKDVIVAIAFIVAFLIFSVAIFMLPQAA